MSSSLPQTATNAQSLNGILTLSDGIITIENGVISGLTELDLIDLQVSDTATIENLVVNNQIDMTSGQIKNVATPTDNGDATNKQFVDTNFLNKTTTLLQSIFGKVQFTNATTDLPNNPVISMVNSVSGGDGGMFIRLLKNVVVASNTQLGGLSACDKNAGNTIIRVADLIFSRGINGEARMELKVIDGNRTPLTITDGAFTSRNNNHTFLKQDLTDLLNYTTATDKWIMYKPLDMNTTNKIINVATPTANGDATNKQFVDLNFLSKTTSTTQAVAGKIEFIENYPTGITLPILDLISSTAGASNGSFIRTYKNVNRTANLEIGGLSYISEVPTNTARREVDLIFRTNANTLAEMVINLNNATKTPLLINEDKYEMKNNNYNILKEDGTQLLTYSLTNDYWSMGKNLNMATNSITNVGNLTINNQIDMTNGNIINLLDPVSAQQGATKNYVDTHSNNQNYLLRDGSLPMLGNLQMGSNNITNCNDITSTGSQFFGTNSTNNLDVKSSAFFEADVLIETNKHLAFYNSDLSTESGMRMYFDRSLGSLGRFLFDMRGSEIQFRTDPSSTPTSERVKINNNETTINNNLICNGNVTLGNNTTSDTTTINSVATFNGVTTIDNNFLVNGNTTLGNFATGDTLTCNCQATFPNTSKLTFEGGSILSFDSGAEIHGFRIKLKSVGTNYTISSGSDLTNDGILCTNLFPDNIIITMPARSYVWNNRKIIIKSQTGNVTIRQATGTFSTTRNNSTADYDITQDYLCKTHIFDSDFGTNGKIWSID